MFETLTAAPPDAILGLNEAFKRDPATTKINLGVGVFKDETGVTPILESVKQAERRLLESEDSKAYLPISGHPEYADHVARFLFGDQVERDRIAVIQSPGGTAALRIAGDFLKDQLPGGRLWLSNPTWANHPNVFTASGLDLHTYRYFDSHSNALDFEAMRADLGKVSVGDVVLLHGCCHNPTGVDLTNDQWEQVGQLLADRGALPLVDFAYQGFAEGLEEDAAGLRSLLRHHGELLVCSSFSKNFGLYRERVGALAALSSNAKDAETVISQLKKVVRSNYSNPPSHGASIVATVLDDADLTRMWKQELAQMRDRINGLRALLVERLRDAGMQRDFEFIKQQRGMFSFSGLTPTEVDQLREQYSIYMVRSGRINVAGITHKNVDYLCQSIAAVIS